jgi:hypothetical protein
LSQIAQDPFDRVDDHGIITREELTRVILEADTCLSQRPCDPEFECRAFINGPAGQDNDQGVTALERLIIQPKDGF